MGFVNTVKNVVNNLKTLDSDEYGQTSVTINEGYSPMSSYSRLDRSAHRTKDKTMMSVICTRIAVDVSSLSFNLIQTDDNGRFSNVADDPINHCLTIAANKDQSGRELIADAVYSMLEEGCIGIFPVITSREAYDSESYKVYNLRVCQIIQWYPNAVKIKIYNENTGEKVERIVPKSMVAICENPFYQIMNEENSTGKRLNRKLNMLDSVDEASSSGKLNMIIQMPFALKGSIRNQQAENRKAQIEEQLTTSRYGVAYTDATEKIIQLNRPLENNLMGQIEYLTNLMLSQLGITQGILDGSANQTTMQAYYNRIIEPITSTIVDSMNRTFLTKTAITQGKIIRSIFDPFKLVPPTELIELTKSLIANEILSGNEVRAILGKKPSDDPRADELRNKNINETKQDGE